MLQKKRSTRQRKVTGEFLDHPENDSWGRCTDIGVLFIGDYLRLDISIPVALFFIIGMMSLVIGLLIFLREIFIATASLRIGPQ